MTRRPEGDVPPKSSPGGAGVAASGLCSVWGVLNVTPDSFSDGGRFADAADAVTFGCGLAAAGASVIDVGGESTRPSGKTYGAGAQPVSVAEELHRVVPVVEGLVAAGVPVSVDTTKPEVAAAGLAAGATYVNDVSMGASTALLEVLAGRPEAQLVLMHNRGQGQRSGAAVGYADVAAEALQEVLAAVEKACEIGVERSRIWIDPGIGFAKTAQQSLLLLSRLDDWVATRLRVLVGASRKSFIPVVCGREATADQRLGGSVAAALLAAQAGSAAVRVHDVGETVQALALQAASRSVGDAPC